VTANIPVREEDVVAAIAQITERPGSRVLVGIGDDAALWQPTRSHRSVITTDALVEDVHFSRATLSLHDIGWRAMTANASDIAAMGARGVLATIALGLPRAFTSEEMRELYRGFADCADENGIVIAGGDLTRAPALTIAIAAVGEVRASNVKLRSGGRVGDIIAVTGELGASRAGLDVLEDKAHIGEPLRAQAIEAHARPSARSHEGRWFGASANVHAMMDCSDGLSTDLARLCAASGCGALIDTIPVAPGARAVAEALSVDPVTYALAGGEEYELIVAVAPRAFAHLAERFRTRFGRPLLRVGRLRAGDGVAVRNSSGEEEPLAQMGWDHFR
jgi:thiamine-monophosphate kinase